MPERAHSARKKGEMRETALAEAPVNALDALGRITWLADVPFGTLERLAEQAVLHRVPKGGILFEQSEIPSFAQFLIAGGVDLIAVEGSNEVLIEALSPVDMLLPAAVLNRQPYLARARVREEAQLVLIHADTFRDAVASDHALCLALSPPSRRADN